MVAFSRLFLAFSAVAGTMASPFVENFNLRKATSRGASNFNLGLDHVLNQGRNHTVHRRNSVDYDQDFTTGGDVVFTPDGSSFTVDWDTSDDFVTGVGWNPGLTLPITFSGSFDVSGTGTSLLSVYGWSENPLVEYYVVEDNANAGSFGTVKGSLTSDGSEYIIWFNTRVDEPSILGTSTFNQYISVRDSPRSSGTVTVENHFNAWAALGMDLGTFNLQVIAVESFNGAEGAATQSVSD